MHQSYAVYWNEPNGPRYAGRLDLEPTYAQLVGSGAQRSRSRLRIFFDEIAFVRYERGRLRLGRRHGRTLEIGSVDGPGALRELADRLQAAAIPA